MNLSVTSNAYYFFFDLGYFYSVGFFGCDNRIGAAIADTAVRAG